MEFEDFKENLPDLLGDDYFNDPETKEQPTKYFENVDSYATLAKRAVNADRKISAHGEELKKATEGMIKIPGEGATPEEIVAYRQAQGVPDGPDGYDLAIPEEGKEGYETIANIVKDVAHKAGIPLSKLKALWEPVVNALAMQVKEQEAIGQELLAADIQALKDVKKEKYDSFIAGTDKVAAHFDVIADPDAGIEENLVGSNFMSLMESMGIKDVPVVREFLGAIGPLVFEGKTSIGAGAGAAAGKDGWYTDYKEVEDA